MQQEFYTSFIKINGIPLLPPLMTDGIREEMRRYKSLAVEVERKIKEKQPLKRSNKCVQADIIKSVDGLKSVKYSSDSDMSTHNTLSDTNSDSHSKMTIVEPTRQVNGEQRDKNDIQFLASDVQQTEFQICSPKNIVNDVQLVMSDINQNEHDDGTKIVTPNKDSESWKPEIPRTLDVIPIMLSDKENNTPTPVSRESDNPPKLSRQGSYVLDTPSPMLLAHMHSSELSNRDYVPTCTTSNISQRKQWNIAQSKVEWENTKIAVENTKVSNKTDYAQELTSRAELIHIEPYQINKFINSTETIVSQEKTDKSNITLNKNSENTDDKKHSLVEKSERDSEVNILSLATQLQESMKEENSRAQQVFYLSENEHRDKIKEYKNDEDATDKMKLFITSDKLLTVYKEIEEMHKKKMVELINRQRKEQSQLQAEFQKQQKLLLTEIQKCSSEMLRQVDASNVTTNQSLLLNNETNLGDISEKEKHSNTNPYSNLDAEQHNNSKVLSTDHTNVIMCPLEYIPSKNLYLLRHCKSSITNAFPSTLDFDFTEKQNLCDVTYNNNNNDDDITNGNHKSYDRVVFRSSTVNRQLFPLDSNTTHVPVIDTSVYLDKHIHAVNIINAYARGYLVRRLMRTQRVITLKKIYKEALQCMLKLHVDAPLSLAEVDFLHRLQLQCDAASMNIVELFAQSPAKRMKVIAHDREIKQSRAERPASARSYSFATQKTLARKNLKEFESTMIKYQQPSTVKKSSTRSRCQTWTSDIRDKHVSPNPLHQTIRRSTSTGTVRKPWR
ncbi:uncharacterized protein LOC109858904 [Pseudomyrmex gracilis]|uniref:uncharacterized protein LOC109858904 n=1 Tax=Pseudomyrmex gracilis TaxID=219809 RepID=UPI000994D185|nr:uncharacterized protein LOC109858904 [Pseudomyrmex gracilis]